MARQPTTRLQVSGYRFLVRRMEHALLRGDIRMLHDPMRAQSLSLIAGCILAVVVVALCAILAFLRPNAGLGDAAIVMSRDSGALYVRVGDTLHPVVNLASAHLITGSAAKPELVSSADVDNAKRGPLLGIPGRARRHRTAVVRQRIRLDGMRRRHHDGDRRPDNPT